MSGSNLNPAAANEAAQENKRMDDYEFSAPGSLMVLQSLLFFDRIFTWILFTISLIAHVAKLLSLPYPEGVWGLEILAIVLYLMFSLCRIDAGSTANKLEAPRHIISFIFCACFTIVGNGIMMGV